MNRNLDGLYFRIERDGKFESICISDMTQKERETLLKNTAKFGVAYHQTIINHLCDSLKKVGDTFDIFGTFEE